MDYGDNKYSRPLCSWCRQNDFKEGCDDCPRHDINHDKIVDFYFSSVPKWPGNKINIQNLIDRYNKAEGIYLAPAYDPEESRDSAFDMTTEEIAEIMDLSNRSVKRIIKRALKKLQGHLKAEDVLYYGEKTNFFNPNQGDYECQIIRSLLQG